MGKHYTPKTTLPREQQFKLDHLIEELARGNMRLAHKLISLAINSGISRDCVDDAKRKADGIAKERLLLAQQRLF